jgi:hypothetical protein
MDDPARKAGEFAPRAAMRRTDLSQYESASEEAGQRLGRLSPPALKQHRVVSVRCPERGCILVAVYGLPRREGGENFLAAFSTSRGKLRYRFLNWAFQDDGWAPPWFPASCRHGSVRVEVGWLLDGPVALVRRWRSQEDVARGPVTPDSVARLLTVRPTTMPTDDDHVEPSALEMRAAVVSRTFHPDPDRWHRKSARQGTLEDTSPD